jgi:hypothetical protein
MIIPANTGRAGIAAGPHCTDGPTVQSGACFGLFAYDIALAINLNDAERLLTGVKQREAIQPDRRMPRSVQYQPAPLRIVQATGPIPIAGFQTARNVDVAMYDFGAVSIMYRIPLRGPLADLLALGDELYANPELLADSRRRIDELMMTLRPALLKPGVSEEVEDYALYQIDAFEPPWDVSRVLAERGDVVARILRSEPGPLSEQQVADALFGRVSYSPGDMAIMDWNSALLMGGEGDDVRTVLEFANVELLEMRFLDRRLDASLEEAYAALSRRGVGRTLRAIGKEVRRIAQLQADAAILFEGVNNSLKLVGDQYLARIYRAAYERFHLPEWDASILRKLQTLESIYDKLSDQQAARRMEALEWIIIALIAVSIVLSLGG